jgi:hypothetical protein
LFEEGLWFSLACCSVCAELTAGGGDAVFSRQYARYLRASASCARTRQLGVFQRVVSILVFFDGFDRVQAHALGSCIAAEVSVFANLLGWCW